MSVAAQDDMFRLNQGVHIEWKIPEFFDVSKLENYCLDSPHFDLSGAEWWLRIVFNSQINISSYIYLSLEKKWSPFINKVNVAFTSGIMKTDGSVLQSRNLNYLFNQGRGTCGHNFFPSRSKLCSNKEDVARDGAVTFFCSAHIVDGDGSTALAGKKSASMISSSDEINGYQRKIKCLEEKLSLSVKEKETVIVDSHKKIQELKQEFHHITGKIKDQEEKLCVARKQNKSSLDDSQKKFKENCVETLSQNFKELFVSGHQADFTIRVKDKEFKAHKLVLSARSSVFRAMFEVDMTEKNSGSVDIHDCESNIFQDFLVFIYTANCDILSPSNAFGLYLLADKYDINDLKTPCSDCMARNISAESVCDVAHLATLHGEQELLKTATEYFVNNMYSICTSTQCMSFLVEHPTTANELLLKSARKLQSQD